MSGEFSAGPLLLSARQIIPVLSVFVSLLTVRLIGPGSRSQRRAAVDEISTLLVIFLVFWKIAPVFSQWEAVVHDPRVLLVAPGGMLGGVLGSTAVTLRLLFGWLRAGRPSLSAQRLRENRVIVLMALVIALTTLTFVTANGVLLAVTYGAEREIPDFSGSLIAPSGEEEAGRLVELSEYRGHVVVVNFWATWCVPCRAENQVKQWIASLPDDDLVLLSVNMTRSEAGGEVVLEYLREWDITYPVLADPSGAIASTFNVRGTPTTIFIGADGRIRDRIFGAMSRQSARRAIQRARGG